MNNKQLKEQLVKLLLEGKQVTVRWDCGGDEAFAYPAIDGKELQYEDAFSEELAEYIIQKLNLPDAGEFYLKGGGRIFIEDDSNIVIEHTSVMAGVVDYDEEKEEEIYSEEEQESGKQVLFEL